MTFALISLYAFLKELVNSHPKGSNQKAISFHLTENFLLSTCSCRSAHPDRYQRWDPPWISPGPTDERHRCAVWWRKSSSFSYAHLYLSPLITKLCSRKYCHQDCAINHLNLYTKRKRKIIWTLFLFQLFLFLWDFCLCLSLHSSGGSSRLYCRSQELSYSIHIRYSCYEYAYSRQGTPAAILQ